VLRSLVALLGSYREYGLPIVHVIRVYTGSDVELVGVGPHTPLQLEELE
jgi:hypothetical protein